MEWKSPNHTNVLGRKQRKSDEQNGNQEGNGARDLHAPTFIEKKRNKEEYTKDEIDWWIQQISGSLVQGTQIGAWLMAVYLNGMTSNETTCLTNAMMDSGDVLVWPKDWENILMDKHSTGGVGDKVSLVLAPALAACGGKVPMISGRGLGHTGGTLDKLESIPGFKVSQTAEEMETILKGVGCCIVGQTSNLVPGDGKLYAIRDVTSTVDSIPLAVSSIMSKKGVENVGSLILDVKCGKAAIMKTLERSRELAKSMVSVGHQMGIRTVALITEMDNPIGNTIGNSLEVAEALQCLKNKGSEDFRQLVSELGGYLLHVANKASSEEDGKMKIKSKLEDGSALQKFKEMICLQGVKEQFARDLTSLNMDDIDDVWQKLQKAEKYKVFTVCDGGFIESIDAMALGTVVWEIGGGRKAAGDDINHSVGLRLLRTVGSQVKPGDEWIVAYFESSLSKDLENKINAAVKITSEPKKRCSRILEVIRQSTDKTVPPE